MKTCQVWIYTVFRRFLQKQANVIDHLVRDVKMSVPDVGKERNATFGIHHPERQGWIYAGFPPFVFSFNHQTRNVVDVPAASPFEVFTSVAAKIGARGVAFVGDDCEGTLFVPGGKIPGESSHCRVPQRYDGRGFQFGIAARVRQICKHLVKCALTAVFYFPLIINNRRNPYDGKSQFGNCSAKCGMLKNGFFAHIVHSDDYCPHLLAVFGNPQEGLRMFAGFVGNPFCNGGRPLPYGGVQGEV